MTDQREQEIRQNLRENGNLIRPEARYIFLLLDRERERVDMAEKVVEGTLHHLATCREQVAELLEALERLASIFPGTGEDVMRARALLAKHKEQA